MLPSPSEGFDKETEIIGTSKWIVEQKPDSREDS